MPAPAQQCRCPQAPPRTFPGKRAASPQLAPLTRLGNPALRTSIDALLCGGLRPGELVELSGPPSSGKTQARALVASRRRCA
jgi:hypothetical protein